MNNESACITKNERPCCAEALPAAMCTCVRTDEENVVVSSALRILEARLRVPGTALGSPGEVKQYLTLRLGGLEHESFFVLLLDAQNRLIAADELFRGTLTQTAVYPREVVKLALARNAAAMILAHNHPSGSKEPSPADRAITAALKQALGFIEVRLLDHFIVAGTAQYSFAEHGEL